MKDLSIQISGEPTPAQMERIGAGLRSHHAASGHERNEVTFSVLAYDPEQKLIGAFVGSCLWERLYIKQLWVAETCRGKGLGSKLLAMGEAEGVRRNCRNAHTDTFSWQAPEFYRKRGYKQYGILEDFPPGAALHYITKALA